MNLMPKSSGSIKDQGSDQSLLHRELSNGFPYYYVVTAVNTYGESSSRRKSRPFRVPILDNPLPSHCWVQDMGDGGDVVAQGGNLRLMGMDTSEGQGERVILGTLGNYTKPLITPRGDRVVYTDRQRKKVYVVNWDGSGLRELFGGIGLAVMERSRDGREWIYYGSEVDEGGNIVRRFIGRCWTVPSPGELVWNRTPSECGQFSGIDGRSDGRGQFPLAGRWDRRTTKPIIKEIGKRLLDSAGTR